MRRAREQLLQAACREKHAASAGQHHEELCFHAWNLLQSHLKNSEKNIDFNEFFRDYAAFLTIDDYQTLVAFHEKNPQEQANWRNKLFLYTRSNPQPEGLIWLELLYADHAQWYISQNN